MISVAVETEPSFRAGAQTRLFLGPYEGILGQQFNPNYDVTADGQQILMLPSPDLQSTQSSLGLLVGWPER